MRFSFFQETGENLICALPPGVVFANISLSLAWISAFFLFFNLSPNREAGYTGYLSPAPSMGHFAEEKGQMRGNKRRLHAGNWL